MFRVHPDGKCGYASKMSWIDNSDAFVAGGRAWLRRLWRGARGALSSLRFPGLSGRRGGGLVRPTGPPEKQIAFTIALVGLAAKLAKADGVAVQVETEAFEHCFRVPKEERANVKRMFDLAAKDVAGYDVYAERIAGLLHDNRPLMKDVFECLFNIAAADGILHHAEEDFLRTVSEKFGFTDHEYLSIRHLFVRDPASPYVIFDVDPSINDADLKARHRELVRDNHPDKLIAEGVPQEFLVLADRKLAAINAAYDDIKKMRGLT